MNEGRRNKITHRVNRDCGTVAVHAVATGTAAGTATGAANKCE